MDHKLQQGHASEVTETRRRDRKAVAGVAGVAGVATCELLDATRVRGNGGVDWQEKIVEGTRLERSILTNTLGGVLEPEKGLLKPPPSVTDGED